MTVNKRAFEYTPSPEALAEIKRLEAGVHFLRPMPQVVRPGPFVQCSAPVADPSGIPGWRKQRYERTGRDPECCQMWAVAAIDSRPLCSRHAGEAALRILFESQSAPASATVHSR